MFLRGRHRSTLLLALLVVALACGKKAPPLPPEPRGPHTPESLDVRQLGRGVQVAFVLPRPRGAKLSQEMVRVELIRVTYLVENAPPPDPDAFRRRGELVHVELADSLEAGRLLLLSDPSLAALGAAGVGSTLRYAVRVLDRRGRPSSWVAAPDLVLLPAANAPERLSAEPTAAGIRLIWQADGEYGYNIYRSANATIQRAPINAQPIRATEYLDAQVEIGRSYTYRVRRLLADGRPRRESSDSLPTEVTAVDRFPPQPPLGLVAVQEGAGVRLFWDPSPERDLRGYRVSRSLDGGPFVPIGPDPLERPLYLDADLSPGRRVRYQVRSIDSADPPNVSPPAETDALMLIDEPAAGQGDGR